jgi:hypothetical protein
MNYKFLSPNVIMAENFLPPLALQKIKIDLLNNRSRFGIPKWSNPDGTKESDEFYSKSCGALDYWIKAGETIPDNHSHIASLDKWFYHQGFFHFLKEINPNSVFNFLQKNKTHDIHLCAYNNSGYYNWHNDNLPFFTFNLILNETDNLEGGEMLIMDEGKIIEIPNLNNYMVVFPSYISHSIKIIKSKNGKDVPFPQQRFSIQYWTRCN